MAEHQPLAVAPAEAGLKLVQFLDRRLAGQIAGGELMRWIRSGQVRVDGGRAKPFDRLAAGQLIRVPPAAHAALAALLEKAPPGRPLGLPVVFEDERLLVVNKPAGLATQPGSQVADSVHDRLVAAFPGTQYVPGLVHRLDKDTSGLLVVGKTAAAVRELQALFKSREVEKVYLAWVHGRWLDAGRVLLADKLLKTGQGRVLVDEEAGREAYAWVEPLLTGEAASLLAVGLLTGRTHQIRVQLASRGQAIIGDRKYGRADRVARRERLLLHAWRLCIEGRCFEALPDWGGDFAVPAGVLAGL
jgi:23S rRNA pseudouridine955/2504/2580 synthase